MMSDDTTPDQDQRSAVDAVTLAFTRILGTARPDLWVMLRDESDVLIHAAKLDTLPTPAKAALPLFGHTVAVSDTIDVAGLPTTGACPAFSYIPDATAIAVQRLVDAGAIILGKTNLDQFGIGLVGAHTPHGPVTDARRRGYASGGAASGAAVSTALGHVDLAVAVDTLGDARIPAAFAGIFAIKPTRELVPTTGILHSARSLDTLSVLASDLPLAERALWVMVGPDSPDQQSSFTRPASSTASGGPAPVVAVPDDAQLTDLSGDAAVAFADAAARLVARGVHLVPISVDACREIAKLLDSGPRVDAERFASVGEFADQHPQEVEPYIGNLLRAGGDYTASECIEAYEKGETLRNCALTALGDADALLLPTTLSQPTLDEVIIDPRGSNRRLGTYSSFANLVGMAAVAVPSGLADGGQFGVSVLARGFDDQVAIDLARCIAVPSPGPTPDSTAPA